MTSLKYLMPMCLGLLLVSCGSESATRDCGEVEYKPSENVELKRIEADSLYFYGYLEDRNESVGREAITVYKKAIEMDSCYYLAFINLQHAYESMDSVSAARDVINSFVKVHPDSKLALGFKLQNCINNCDFVSAGKQFDKLKKKLSLFRTIDLYQLAILDYAINKSNKYKIFAHIMLGKELRKSYYEVREMADSARAKCERGEPSGFFN